MVIEKLKLEVLSIMDEGYHLFLNAQIGKMKVRLLVDTGASKTVLAKSFADRHLKNMERQINSEQATGLGSNSIDNEVCQLKSIRFGKIKVKNLLVAVLDLQHVNDTYEKLSQLPIHGVLGSDVMMRLQANIDFKKGVLSLKYLENKKNYK